MNRKNIASCVPVPKATLLKEEEMLGILAVLSILLLMMIWMMSCCMTCKGKDSRQGGQEYAKPNARERSYKENEEDKILNESQDESQDDSQNECQITIES